MQFEREGVEGRRWTVDPYLTRASDRSGFQRVGRMMAIWSSGREALEEALIDLGFSATDEFGVFVTYERPRDSLKVHVAPDGMFAAFDRDDQVLGEGAGAQDLRDVLMEAVLVAERDRPRRRSFLDRRTKQKTRSRTGDRASPREDRGEEAQPPLSVSAFSGRYR
jgi:hypothetical protein